MATMTDGEQSPPAHRPSRRTEIVDAAIRLFARRGFVDASVGDVAEEAEVAVTAVYYHFAGKDELFGAAVRRAFDSITEVVSQARGADGEPLALDRVIDAVWGWIDRHPDEATLVYLQLPGATRQTAAARHEFEEHSARRAFGYFGGAVDDESPQERAAQTLAARTLVDVLVSVHTLRLADGPLSGEPDAALRSAVHALADRLVTS